MLKKFALTYVDKNGLRVHYAPSIHRKFFDVKKAGEAHLKAIYDNTSIDTINSIFGINPQFKVIPIECYPSGDAVKNVFEN